MGKVSVRLSEFRQNIPKNVQWLLLVAAFIIVLILFTLLISGKKNAEHDIQKNHGVTADLSITPDVINWADILVGQKKQQKVELSATAPVKILSVTAEKDVNGFATTTACTQMGMINDTITCAITLKYEPTVATKVEQNIVSVVWHDADATDAMQKTSKIVVTLGATAPVIEKPTPIPEPEPEPEPEPVYSASYDYESEIEYEPEPEPDYYQDDFIAEIESIAPPIPSFSQPVEPIYVRPPESCSDFAFAGYDNYGRQTGWIKPEAGTYKFHPFSDTECDNPTGVYNPDNGIITDINNPGRKIGTDAEHIGFSAILSGVLPELSNAPAVKTEYKAMQLDEPEDSAGAARISVNGIENLSGLRQKPKEDAEIFFGSGQNYALASRQYDRQFILRQYKPIPATIVSDVRADPDTLRNNYLPVRATVDRNVYSDNGRNVIIPTGTLLMGYVTGELPGPYTSVGRMNIKWYQFILPNGVEFNFSGGGDTPFSGDAQGRSGIPGYGSSDYLEQFFMPMLTAIVPAAVNLIAPVSDAFVNQIDLDNNTVVQSGTVRSSELAKNEIITAWNQVAQKLLVDMMDNTVPPFTIAAGTRITVYSPVDLIASCGDGSDGKKCSLGYGNTPRFDGWHDEQSNVQLAQDGSWVGQVRSFATNQYCITQPDGTVKVADECRDEPGSCGGYDYNTLLFYCQSQQYKAKNMARQEAVYKNQQDSSNQKSISYVSSQGEQAYNEQVLGLNYNDDGSIQNPFNEPEPEYEEPAAAVITCEDGSLPDDNGCCAGEIYTDMGEMGFNCCPESGGDCFPPIL